MEKLTLSQLFSAFRKHNEDNHITSQFEDPHALKGVIVFSEKNWPQNKFPLESRSYAFSSDNKYFISGMCGNSIYAETLDKTDRGVRLDWYLNDWKYIDYCYIME